MLRRSMLLLLCAVILASAVCDVGFVKAAEQEYNDRMHYVFVIDASIKGEKGDICAAACETICNVLPQEDAWVGVIAYGYDGDDEDLYTYSSVDRPASETGYVHQILALEQAGSPECQALYERLLGAFSADEQTSPHGQGLLAGVDMLCTAGVPREEGCVIWLTDGIKSSDEWTSELSSRNLAVDIASQNLWPIYTIHTDYGENAKMKQAEALRMMKEIAEKTDVREGDAPAYQRVDMSDAAEGKNGDNEPFLCLHEKLMEILPGEKWKKKPLNGVVRTAYTVENLTSEYTIAFVGAGVTEVSVEFPYSETKVYRESVVDGDVKVERGAYGFVVTLNNPDPEEWVVNGHGNGEMLVYRNIRFNVDIALRLENAEGVELVSGREETMNLGHGENIRFVPDYMHGGGPLILHEGTGNMTAKLVIQSRKPEKAHEFRNLMEIGMPLDGGSHPMEWLTTGKLGEQEYLAYQERSGIYRARVVLEWTGKAHRKVVGDWFSFGSENLPPVVHSEELPGVTFLANEQRSICLSECIEKESIDCWKIELMPNDGFVLLDEKREELNPMIIETHSDSIHVQAPGYVGTYDFVLLVEEGKERYKVKVQAGVEPYPEYDPEDLLELKLYLESDWVYSALDWFGFSMGDVMTAEELGPGVMGVDLVGEGADQISIAYANGTLMLMPDAAGVYDLELKIERDAQIPDGNGGYQSQISHLPVRIKVISLANRFGIFASLLLVLGGLVFLCLACLQKFPYPMLCTMMLEDGSGKQIGVTITRDMSPQKPRTQGFIKGAWSRAYGISVEQFIKDFVDNKKKTTLNIQPGGDGLDAMGFWIKENEALLKQGRLGRIKFKGVHSKDYAYRITRAPASNPVWEISVKKSGDEHEPDIPGSIIKNRKREINANRSWQVPANVILTITLDLSQIDPKGIPKEKNEGDSKSEVRKIVMTIQRKQKG